MENFTFVEDQNVSGLQEIKPSVRPRKKLAAGKRARLILCSSISKVVYFIILAVIIPLIVFLLFMNDMPETIIAEDTCLVNSSYKIFCGDNKVNNSTSCGDINCCYDQETSRCFQYEPSRYYYYKANDDSKDPKQILLKPKLTKSPFGKENHKFTLTYADNIPNILKITLTDQPTVQKQKQKNNSPNYAVKLNTTDRFSLNVYRTNQNTKDNLIFSSNIGPMIVSDKYWEWTFHLNAEKLFGLGELEINTENDDFNKIIYRNKADHNVLPILMAYKNKSYHALLINHEGPVEITVLRSKVINIKSYSDKEISLEIFMGPTPKDIFEQMPKSFNKPYEWHFGAHICRGQSVKTLQELLDIYNTFKNQVTFDYESDCIHEDFLMHLITDELGGQTVSLDKKFLPSFPPQIPVRGMQIIKADKFYTDANSNIYKGKYKNQEVAYPDFDSPEINTLLENVFEKLNLIAKVDGVVLTSNWPQDDSFTMKKTNDFQYLSKNVTSAMSGTLPWSLLNTLKEQHITNHNNYGALQAKAIVKAFQLPLKSFTLSASAISAENDLSLGLILQNIAISWDNLRKAIRATLFNSVFSSPMFGVPVCGSTSYDPKLHDKLCLRWYLMAATMPVFRFTTDADKNNRDPTGLAAKYLQNKAIEIMKIRNKFIPYYRSTMLLEKLLVRPMFFDYPLDTNVINLDTQYMVGSCLLVSQPVLPDVSLLNVYLPKGIWYEFWSGQLFKSEKGMWIKIPIVDSDWISFIREGCIIPLVEKDPGTGEKIVDLVVALRENNTANTQFFIEYDDADLEIKIQVEDDQLSLENSKEVCSKVKFLPTISIYFTNEDVKIDNKLC